MFDPLSVTASVIAVVTVAAQSCDSLCTLFRSYGDTAEYLKHYISMLEALKAIFASITELDGEASHYFAFDQGLRGRLEECGLYLQAIEKIVMPSHNKLQMSKADRLWTKMKWSTTSQRQRIDKLMIRIESHCKNFTMSLLLLNTRLGLRSNSEALQHSEKINMPTILSRRKPIALESHNIQRPTRCSRASDAVAPTYGRSASKISSIARAKRGNLLGAQYISYQGPHKITKIRKAVAIPASCNTSLLNVPQASETHFVDLGRSRTGPRFPEREDLSFRINLVKKLERSLMHLLCWVGHVNRVEYPNEKTPSSAVVHLHSGYAIGLAMTGCWCLALRLELQLYIFVRPKRAGIGLSFGCDLKFPSVIFGDSETVALCLCGDVDSMKKKFATGEANPFHVLPNGSTLLHLAAMRNHFEMVKFLIQQGALLNAVDEFGDTPLHRSLELAKDYNISRILIENGADICTRNVDGETPLHTHFSSVVERVLLIYADLLDYSVCDDDGRTLLHHLVWSSRTPRETFERVLTRSGRMNCMVDREQKSLLHLAAQRGNLAVLESILTHLNLDINMKDKIGRTPLHYAIESSRAQETIEFLVSRGADTSAQDHRGQSALYIAAKRGKKPAIRALGRARLSSELSTEDHRRQTCMPEARKNEVQNAPPASTRMSKLQWRDWRVSNLTSSFGKAVSVVDADIEGSLEDTEEKNQHLPTFRTTFYERLSGHFTPIVFELPCKAVRMLSFAILLYGVWLAVHGK